MLTGRTIRVGGFVVPVSIASHIHFGAASPTAIERRPAGDAARGHGLLAGGVRSRRLTHAAASVLGQVASADYNEVRQLLELGFALDMDFDPAQAVPVSLAATAGCGLVELLLVHRPDRSECV